MHSDFLPTGRPTVGHKRSYGELPEDQKLGVGVVGLHEGHTLLVALRASGLCKAVAGCDISEEKRASAAAAMKEKREGGDASCPAGARSPCGEDVRASSEGEGVGGEGSGAPSPSGEDARASKEGEIRLSLPIEGRAVSEAPKTESRGGVTPTDQPFPPAPGTRNPIPKSVPPKPEPRDPSPDPFQITDQYEQLLANPRVQIVAIYTPDTLHADQIEQAMRAGKHVICTKPLINDPKDIQRLKQTAQETKMRLQVGQSTRFGEPFLRQREDFEAGKFGEIEVVDAHYNHRMDWYYEKSPWTVTDTHWAYLGLSHPVDLVRWYLGEIAEVHAMGTLTALGQAHKMQTPDAITVNLRARNGRIGRVLGNYGVHELSTARSMIECHLMGSKGASLARYPDLRYTYHTAQGIEIEEDMHHAMAGYHYRHELKGMHYGEFCNYTDYFARCILDNTPNSPDLEEGLSTVLVMAAIVESLETGQPISLP